MDYQASASSKIIPIGFLKTLILAGLVVLFPLHASAQATNPLSGDVTVFASVLLIQQPHPDTPPLPPGPINMTNAVDVAVFKGYAYPGSVVSLLKNGVVVTTYAAANADGSFDIHLQNLNPGTYSFGIRAEDPDRLKSKLLLFSVYIAQGVVTVIDGIYIPPTITSDKVEVKRGEVISFFGRSIPNAEVRVSFNSGTTEDTEVIKKTRANASGTWMYMLNSGEFSLGDYDVKARSVTDKGITLYSDLISFRNGDTTRLRAKVSELAGFRRKCDLNDDNRVNLLDFSIMAFWYKRLVFPPRVDMNSDNNINLTDLSILAYCWTG